MKLSDTIKHTEKIMNKHHISWVDVIFIGVISILAIIVMGMK